MGKGVKGRGDCYVVHAKALIGGAEEGLLCHGSVLHPVTGRHGHCWLERQVEFGPGFAMTMCRDLANGNDVYWPQELYYKAGQVEQVQRYTAEQVAANCLRTGHFGPWDEKEERTGVRKQRHPRRKA